MQHRWTRNPVPHRLESSNTSSACGALCARLSCSGQDTILHHPFLGPCKVTAIDYKHAVMKVILFVSMSPCPLQKLIFHRLPLDDGCSLYKSIPEKIVRCSKEFKPTGTSPVEFGSSSFIADHIAGPISCLSDTKHYTYLVYAQLYLYLLPLDCKIASAGYVPIPGHDYMYDGPTLKERAESVISFAETTVSWMDRLGSIPDNCTDCEHQKQRCGFSTQRNRTFCMSQDHHGTIAKC